MRVLFWAVVVVALGVGHAACPSSGTSTYDDVRNNLDCTHWTTLVEIDGVNNPGGVIDLAHIQRFENGIVISNSQARYVDVSSLQTVDKSFTFEGNTFSSHVSLIGPSHTNPLVVQEQLIFKKNHGPTTMTLKYLYVGRDWSTSTHSLQILHNKQDFTWNIEWSHLQSNQYLVFSHNEGNDSVSFKYLSFGANHILFSHASSINPDTPSSLDISFTNSELQSLEAIYNHGSSVDVGFSFSHANHLKISHNTVSTALDFSLNNNRASEMKTGFSLFSHNHGPSFSLDFVYANLEHKYVRYNGNAATTHLAVTTKYSYFQETFETRHNAAKYISVVGIRSGFKTGMSFRHNHGSNQITLMLADSHLTMSDPSVSTPLFTGVSPSFTANNAVTTKVALSNTHFHGAGMNFQDNHNADTLALAFSKTFIHGNWDQDFENNPLGKYITGNRAAVLTVDSTSTVMWSSHFVVSHNDVANTFSINFNDHVMKYGHFKITHNEQFGNGDLQMSISLNKTNNAKYDVMIEHNTVDNAMSLSLNAVTTKYFDFHHNNGENTNGITVDIKESNFLGGVAVYNNFPVHSISAVDVFAKYHFITRHNRGTTDESTQLSLDVQSAFLGNGIKIVYNNEVGSVDLRHVTADYKYKNALELSGLSDSGSVGAFVITHNSGTRENKPWKLTMNYIQVQRKYLHHNEDLTHITLMHSRLGNSLKYRKYGYLKISHSNHLTHVEMQNVYDQNVQISHLGKASYLSARDVSTKYFTLNHLQRLQTAEIGASDIFSLYIKYSGSTSSVEPAKISINDSFFTFRTMIMYNTISHLQSFDVVDAINHVFITHNYAMRAVVFERNNRGFVKYQTGVTVAYQQLKIRHNSGLNNNDVWSLDFSDGLVNEFSSFYIQHNRGLSQVSFTNMSVGRLNERDVQVGNLKYLKITHNVLSSSQELSLTVTNSGINMGMSIKYNSATKFTASDSSFKYNLLLSHNVISSIDISNTEFFVNQKYFPTSGLPRTNSFNLEINNNSGSFLSSSNGFPVKIESSAMAPAKYVQNFLMDKNKYNHFSLQYNALSTFDVRDSRLLAYFQAKHNRLDSGFSVETSSLGDMQVKYNSMSTFSVTDSSITSQLYFEYNTELATISLSHVTLRSEYVPILTNGKFPAILLKYNSGSLTHVTIDHVDFNARVVAPDSPKTSPFTFNYRNTPGVLTLWHNQGVSALNVKSSRLGAVAAYQNTGTFSGNFEHSHIGLVKIAHNSLTHISFDRVRLSNDIVVTHNMIENHFTLKYSRVDAKYHVLNPFTLKYNTGNLNHWDVKIEHSVINSIDNVAGIQKYFLVKYNHQMDKFYLRNNIIKHHTLVFKYNNLNNLSDKGVTVALSDLDWGSPSGTSPVGNKGPARNDFTIKYNRMSQLIMKSVNIRGANKYLLVSHNVNQSSQTWDVTLEDVSFGSNLSSLFSKNSNNVEVKYNTGVGKMIVNRLRSLGHVHIEYNHQDSYLHLTHVDTTRDKNLVLKYMRNPVSVKVTHTKAKYITLQKMTSHDKMILTHLNTLGLYGKYLYSSHSTNAQLTVSHVVATHRLILTHARFSHLELTHSSSKYIQVKYFQDGFTTNWVASSGFLINKGVQKPKVTLSHLAVGKYLTIKYVDGYKNGLDFSVTHITSSDAMYLRVQEVQAKYGDINVLISHVRTREVHREAGIARYSQVLFTHNTLAKYSKYGTSGCTLCGTVDVVFSHIQTHSLHAIYNTKYDGTPKKATHAGFTNRGWSHTWTFNYIDVANLAFKKTNLETSVRLSHVVAKYVGFEGLSSGEFGSATVTFEKSFYAKYVALDVKDGTNNHSNNLLKKYDAFDMSSLSPAMCFASRQWHLGTNRRGSDKYCQDQKCRRLTATTTTTSCKYTQRGTVGSADLKYWLHDKNINLCMTSAEVIANPSQCHVFVPYFAAASPAVLDISGSSNGSNLDLSNLKLFYQPYSTQSWVDVDIQGNVLGDVTFGARFANRLTIQDNTEIGTVRMTHGRVKYVTMENNSFRSGKSAQLENFYAGHLHIKANSAPSGEKMHISLNQLRSKYITLDLNTQTHYLSVVNSSAQKVSIQSNTFLGGSHVTVDGLLSKYLDVETSHNLETFNLENGKFHYVDILANYVDNVLIASNFAEKEINVESNQNLRTCHVKDLVQGLTGSCTVASNEGPSESLALSHVTSTAVMITSNQAMGKATVADVDSGLFSFSDNQVQSVLVKDLTSFPMLGKTHVGSKYNLEFLSNTNLKYIQLNSVETSRGLQIDSNGSSAGWFLEINDVVTGTGAKYNTLSVKHNSQLTHVTMQGVHAQVKYVDIQFNHGVSLASSGWNLRISHSSLWGSFYASLPHTVGSPPTLLTRVEYNTHMAQIHLNYVDTSGFLSLSHNAGVSNQMSLTVSNVNFVSGLAPHINSKQGLVATKNTNTDSFLFSHIHLDVVSEPLHKAGRKLKYSNKYTLGITENQGDELTINVNNVVTNRLSISHNTAQVLGASILVSSASIEEGSFYVSHNVADIGSEVTIDISDVNVRHDLKYFETVVSHNTRLGSFNLSHSNLAVLEVSSNSGVVGGTGINFSHLDMPESATLISSNMPSKISVSHSEMGYLSVQKNVFAVGFVGNPCVTCGRVYFDHIQSASLDIEHNTNVKDVRLSHVKLQVREPILKYMESLQIANREIDFTHRENRFFGKYHRVGINHNHGDLSWNLSVKYLTSENNRLSDASFSHNTVLATASIKYSTWPQTLSMKYNSLSYAMVSNVRSGSVDVSYNTKLKSLELKHLVTKGALHLMHNHSTGSQGSVDGWTLTVYDLELKQSDFGLEYPTNTGGGQNKYGGVTVKYSRDLKQASFEKIQLWGGFSFWYNEAKLSQNMPLEFSQVKQLPFNMNYDKAATWKSAKYSGFSLKKNSGVASIDVAGLTANSFLISHTNFGNTASSLSMAFEDIDLGRTTLSSRHMSRDGADSTTFAKQYLNYYVTVNQPAQFMKYNIVIKYNHGISSLVFGEPIEFHQVLTVKYNHFRDESTLDLSGFGLASADTFKYTSRTSCQDTTFDVQSNTVGSGFTVKYCAGVHIFPSSAFKYREQSITLNERTTFALEAKVTSLGTTAEVSDALTNQACSSPATSTFTYDWFCKNFQREDPAIVGSYTHQQRQFHSFSPKDGCSHINRLLSWHTNSRHGKVLSFNPMVETMDLAGLPTDSTYMATVAVRVTEELNDGSSRAVTSEATVLLRIPMLGASALGQLLCSDSSLSWSTSPSESIRSDAVVDITSNECQTGYYLHFYRLKLDGTRVYLGKTAGRDADQVTSFVIRALPQSESVDFNVDTTGPEVLADVTVDGGRDFTVQLPYNSAISAPTSTDSTFPTATNALRLQTLKDQIAAGTDSATTYETYELLHCVLAHVDELLRVYDELSGTELADYGEQLITALVEKADALNDDVEMLGALHQLSGCSLCWTKDSVLENVVQEYNDALNAPKLAGYVGTPEMTDAITFACRGLARFVDSVSLKTFHLTDAAGSTLDATEKQTYIAQLFVAAQTALVEASVGASLQAVLDVVRVNEAGWTFHVERFDARTSVVLQATEAVKISLEALSECDTEYDIHAIVVANNATRDYFPSPPGNLIGPYVSVKIANTSGSALNLPSDKTLEVEIEVDQESECPSYDCYSWSFSGVEWNKVGLSGSSKTLANPKRVLCRVSGAEVTIAPVCKPSVSLVGDPYVFSPPTNKWVEIHPENHDLYNLLEGEDFRVQGGFAPATRSSCQCIWVDTDPTASPKAGNRLSAIVFEFNGGTFHVTGNDIYYHQGGEWVTVPSSQWNPAELAEQGHVGASVEQGTFISGELHIIWGPKSVTRRFPWGSHEYTHEFKATIPGSGEVTVLAGVADAVNVLDIYFSSQTDKALGGLLGRAETHGEVAIKSLASHVLSLAA